MCEQEATQRCRVLYSLELMLYWGHDPEVETAALENSVLIVDN